MQDARILAKFLIDRKAVSPPLLASWKEANFRGPAVTRQAQLAQTAPMGDRQLPIGCLGRGLTPDLAPVHSRHGDSAAEGFACNATVGTRRVGFRHDFDRWKSRLSFCLAASSAVHVPCIFFQVADVVPSAATLRRQLGFRPASPAAWQVL